VSIERMGMCAGCGGIMWIDQMDTTPFGSTGRTYMDGAARCEGCGGSMEARWAVHQWPDTVMVDACLVEVYAGPPAPYPHLPGFDEWATAWRKHLFPSMDTEHLFWLANPPDAAV
jgi:hypothetical protein